MADSKKPAGKKTAPAAAKKPAAKPQAVKATTPPVDQAKALYQKLYQLRKAIEAHDEEVAAAKRSINRAKTLDSPATRAAALIPAQAALDQALAARYDAREAFMKLKSNA